MNFHRLAMASALLIALFYLGLIASLFHFFSPATLSTLLQSRTLGALGLSLAAATLATAFALPLAIPAAYALSRLTFPLKSLAEALLDLPLVVSPAALGAMLLMFFSQPFGAWIQEHTFSFVFAFWGVVLAQFTTVLGLMTRFAKSALDEIPGNYESMARSLGAAPFLAFRLTTLPLARRGLLAASLLGWAKALGEFGATITLAGTLPLRTETLPVAIFLRLSSADLEGAAILIGQLLILGLLLLTQVRRLARSSFHA